MNINKNVLDVP